MVVGASVTRVVVLIAVVVASDVVIIAGLLEVTSVSDDASLLPSMTKRETARSHIDDRRVVVVVGTDDRHLNIMLFVTRFVVSIQAV